MTIPQNKSALKPFIKQCFKVMFATPAAIGLLEKMHTDLELQPILYKIILHYREVSSDFWVLFEKLIGFTIPIEKDFLTFAVLIFVPVLANRIYSILPTNNEPLPNVPWPDIWYRTWKEKSKIENKWTLLSIASLVYFIFVFAMSYYVQAVIVGLFTSWILVGIFSLLWAVLVSIFKLIKLRVKESVKNLFNIDRLLLSIAIILFIFITYMINKIDIAQPVNDDGFALSVMDAIPDGLLLFNILLFGTILILKYKLRSPAYTMLWTSGIWIVNYTMVKIIPWIEEYAKSLS
jgi:hypothetical protein